MNKFSKGLISGVALTLGTVAGAVFSFKKAVIDPKDEEEAKIEENRKKAVRKSRSAHNG
ncbi:DUF3042 family protein [Lactobacillus sp. S2-2]|uniref:DUF3042 family protein n=1 Tax=Lactobacillus sp. S2-2 TaxID=2692917 RepID=UPI001F2B29F0|nr:DUF3042 family protein [Lactobacillus sp. S2-2]MCF6515119.1 DUF3042 family protein [Lactobacillus sp. S2-2]